MAGEVSRINAGDILRTRELRDEAVDSLRLALRDGLPRVGQYQRLRELNEAIKFVRHANALYGQERLLFERLCDWDRRRKRDARRDEREDRKAIRDNERERWEKEKQAQRIAVQRERLELQRSDNEQRRAIEREKLGVQRENIDVSSRRASIAEKAYEQSARTERATRKRLRAAIARNEAAAARLSELEAGQAVPVSPLLGKSAEVQGPHVRAHRFGTHANGSYVPAVRGAKASASLSHGDQGQGIGAPAADGTGGSAVRSEAAASGETPREDRAV